MKVMKRKSCLMGLMFNFLDCSVHFALHSTGHKEEGVGARRTLQSTLLWVCFIGDGLEAEESTGAWRAAVLGKSKTQPVLQTPLPLPRPAVSHYSRLEPVPSSLHCREADYRDREQDL